MTQKLISAAQINTGHGAGQIPVHDGALNADTVTFTPSYIGYGSSGSTLVGTPDFTWNESTTTLQLGSTSGSTNVVLQITPTASPSNFLVYGANATVASVAGGSVLIYGGTGFTGVGGPGGSVSLIGGNASGSGNNNGGSLFLQGGTATGTGTSGSITIASGSVSGSSSSGSIQLQTNSTNRVTINGSGNVIFNPASAGATLTLNANSSSVALNIASGTLEVNGTVGAVGQVLTSNGTSSPSWTSLSTLGVTSITGTPNQITASSSLGAITLFLPQNINTGAAPIFTGTNFTGLPNAGLTNSSVTIGTTAISLGASAATIAGVVSLTLTGNTSNLTGIGTPVNSSDAVPKSYVDSVALGLSWKSPAVAATTTNLAGTYVGSPTFTLTNSSTQAALQLDGVSLTTGQRVLVKNQTTQSQNGIYSVTNVGSSSTNWVLTRTTDFNEVTPINEVNGAAIYVNQGSTQSNTGWTQIDNVTTFDSSPIQWIQFSGAGSSVSSLTAGVGISVSSPTGVITLANTGVLSFNSRTGAITPTTGDYSFTQISGSLNATQLPSLSITGDLTGSSTAGTATIPVTLAIVNSNVGSFSNASITVNAKGLVTAASSNPPPVVPNPVLITTATYTANVNDLIVADTTATPITVTLPGSPIFGQQVYFVDGAGTWGTNQLTVNGNGANICASSNSLNISVNYNNFSLIYYNVSQGWIISSS